MSRDDWVATVELDGDGQERAHLLISRAIARATDLKGLRHSLDHEIQSLGSEPFDAAARRFLMAYREALD